MRNPLLGLFTLTFLAGTLGAQTADPYEAKVQGLAHPRYAVREKSTRELLAAGEPALKALRAACLSDDPELRRRAEAIAEKIDLAIRSERLLVAPKIALKLDKVPLQQAVDEVAKKTGLHFQLQATKNIDRRRPITLDTGEVPFWDAVDAFYKAAELVEDDNPPAAKPGNIGQMGNIYSGYGSGLRVVNSPIRLTTGKSRLPAATDKAIRVRALPPGLAENKYDAGTGQITVNLDVDAAPTLTVAEIIGVDVRHVRGDDRQEFALAYPATSPFPGYSATEQLLVARQIIIVNGEVVMDNAAGCNPRYPVVFKSGRRHPTKFCELQGFVVARVITPSEPLITVDDVFGKSKGQSKTAAGHTLTITSAHDDEKSGEATIQVRLVASPGTVNQIANFPVQIRGRLRPFVRINRRGERPNMNGPHFDVRGPDGHLLKIKRTELVSTEINGSGVGNEYRLIFAKPTDAGASWPNGISLTLHGRQHVRVEMPFVLKDVPLP